MGYQNMYYGYGHMAGWGVFGLLWVILGWIFLIWIVSMIVRRVVWGSHHRHEKWRRWQEMKTGHSALGILNERYAKGEINREEYEQKKKDISGHE